MGQKTYAPKMSPIHRFLMTNCLLLPALQAISVLAHKVEPLMTERI